jgi:deoxyribonuclease IV
MANIILGSHVGVSGDKMLLGAVEEAISYGSNTFMFYTGAPQNTTRKPISSFKIEEAKKLMIENGIDINNVIVHAPYIINLANNKSSDNFAVNFLAEEIKRVNEIGCKFLVLHPGAHVGMGPEYGMKEIVKHLDMVFEKNNSKVIVLLETMAGKGTEIGRNFDEIKYILEHSKYPKRLGVCLDTCHIHDAGYDLADFDLILKEFEAKISLDKLMCLHINDSKNIKGAAKDRHENIGFGEIGFDKLIKILYHPKLMNIPKILETPWVEEIPPYGLEIKMIKAKKFNPELKKELLNK